MLVKPRPSTVAQPLLDTPLAPLAGWVPIAILYVPDMLLLFAVGFVAGRFFRRVGLLWLTVCVSAYCVFNVCLGGRIWWYALTAVLDANLGDVARYGTLCGLIACAAYAGTLVGLLARQSDPQPGCCKSCGYSLYGLPSNVCPECGTPFSISEGMDAQRVHTKRPSTVPGKCSRDPPARSQIVTRFLVVRVCVLGALLSFFYLLDWMPLRQAQRDVIAWAFRESGYYAITFMHEGSPAINIGETAHLYTAECTCLDLVMTVVPFLWVFGARYQRNIVKIAVAVLIISAANLIRCCAALYLDLIGVARFYAHDLPDHILWWPTVVVVALLALRRDFGRPFAARREQPPVASTGLRSGDVCA